MSEHLSEDRLLELAYGELSPEEAAAAEAHALGCAQCAKPLREIRSVRRVMAELPAMTPPSSAASSLLQYAEQAAGRRRKGRFGWRRWLTPLATVLAFSRVAIVGVRVVREEGPASVLQERSRPETEMRAPVAAAPPLAAPEVQEPAPMDALEAPRKSAPAAEDSPGATGSGSESYARPPPSTVTPAAPQAKVVRRALAKEKMAPARDESENGFEAVFGGSPHDKKLDAPPTQKPTEVLGGVVADKTEEARPTAGAVAHGVTREPERLRAEAKAEQNAAAPARFASAPPAGSTVAEEREKDGRGGPEDQVTALDRSAAAVPAAPPAKKSRQAPVQSEDLSPATPPQPSLDELPRVLASTRGAAREPLLHRLCDEEHRPEREADALASCRALTAEFPHSRWAPAAQERLRAEAPR